MFGIEASLHPLDGAFSGPGTFDVGAREVLLDLFQSAVATGSQARFPNVVDEPLATVSDDNHDTGMDFVLRSDVWCVPGVGVVRRSRRRYGQYVGRTRPRVAVIELNVELILLKFSH